MTNELMTWATMIEVPVFAALFRLIIKNKRESDGAFISHRQQSNENVGLVKDSLAEFKLHVARNYASVNYLKDVENRLTNHLLRIEKKLDQVGGRCHDGRL